MSLSVYVVQSGSIPVKVFASYERAEQYATWRGTLYTDAVGHWWQDAQDNEDSKNVLYYRSRETGRWRRTEWTVTKVNMETMT